LKNAQYEPDLVIWNNPAHVGFNYNNEILVRGTEQRYLSQNTHDLFNLWR